MNYVKEKVGDHVIKDSISKDCNACSEECKKRRKCKEEHNTTFTNIITFENENMSQCSRQK